MEVKSHTNNSQNSDPEFETDPAIINNYVTLHRSGIPINVQLSNEWFYLQLHQFIASLAHHHYGSFMATQGDDLLQSGWLGATEAIDNYDPYCYAITTHFKPYILNQMRCCLSKIQSRCTQRNVSKVRDALSKIELSESNAGYSSQVEQLSVMTGLSQEIVVNSINYINISNPTGFDEIGEFVPDKDIEIYPEQLLMQKEWFTEFYNELQRILTPSEYEQICRRFGLCTEGSSSPPPTVQQGRLPTLLLQKLRSSKVLKQLADQVG